MLKHCCWKSTAVPVVALACLISLPNTLDAQNDFIGQKQSVNRVIQLQPQAGATVVKPQPNTASRIKRKTLPIAAASVQQSLEAIPQVGSEPIRVPQVLQSPIAATAPKVTKRLARLPDAIVAKPVDSPAETAEKVVSKKLDVLPAASAPVKATAKSGNIVSKAQSLIKTEIFSPKFVNVNKPAVVKIQLSNLGDTPVDQVEFLAALPAHVKLVSASPKPASVEGQVLRFALDRFGAGDQREVSLDVIPTERSSMDIVTSVRTENQQKVLIAVREPLLETVINGPVQANIGEKVEHELVIANTGDGVATQVEFDTLFPASLVKLTCSHEGPIVQIEPGKSAKITYESQAIGAGPIQLKSSVRNDDGAQPKLASLDLAIFEPTLQISAIGPKVNFVDRNGIYTLSLENSGKVDVTNVDVALAVPEGMKVTTISREANVDADQGILRWKFDKIASGSVEQIQLMAIAEKEGDQVCSIVVDSHETAEKQIKLATRVTTRANLSVQVKNESGPVQVGGKALFVVELANNGSRNASDVSVEVALPESLKASDSNSQKLNVEGNKITFSEPQIAPGGKVTFRFSAIGQTSGEHIVRTVTQVEGSERRVIAEDTAYVYEISEARVSESLTPNVPMR
jgi:uncharacterized repeat protein (TIGR01451 family)